MNIFKKLEKKQTNMELLETQLCDWESKYNYNLDKLTDLESVRIIFQKAAQITQTQLALKVSEIVSNALAAVFKEPYTFKVEFIRRRNVTECDLLFEKNGKTKKPLNSCGYGAADIASLALRVAYWKLDGEARNVLVLDEPLRNLSLDKQPLASMMIQNLSKMAGGLQFVIVTHNSKLMESADKCFQVTKKNDISYVTEINS